MERFNESFDSFTDNILQSLNSDSTVDNSHYKAMQEQINGMNEDFKEMNEDLKEMNEDLTEMKQGYSKVYIDIS